LRGKDGSWTTIQRIEKVEREVRTYNLEVEGDHAFFVHGYLVHNKEPCEGCPLHDPSK